MNRANNTNVRMRIGRLRRASSDHLTRLKGAVLYLVQNPRYVDRDEDGFNGQRLRKDIFQDILRVGNFESIIETGTWTGNTTGYMAVTSGLPVYTCELSQVFYRVAKVRLRNVQNISFSRSDSRSFLSRLLSTDLPQHKTFFYLDAHWYHDLPLREELEIISSAWKDFVIMVDDFEVPGDAGYGYDDFGGDKQLTLHVFSDVFDDLNLKSFFPSSPSSIESGKKRGCVIVTRQGPTAELLDTLSLLKSPSRIHS